MAWQRTGLGLMAVAGLLAHRALEQREAACSSSSRAWPHSSGLGMLGGLAPIRYRQVRSAAGHRPVASPRLRSRSRSPSPSSLAAVAARPRCSRCADFPLPASGVINGPSVRALRDVRPSPGRAVPRTRARIALGRRPYGESEMASGVRRETVPRSGPLSCPVRDHSTGTTVPADVTWRHAASSSPSMATEGPEMYDDTSATESAAVRRHRGLGWPDRAPASPSTESPSVPWSG